MSNPTQQTPPASGPPGTPSGAGRPAPATARALVVDQRHPGCDDAGAGSADRPLRTIQAAAERAAPGDLVLVRAGVYREHVRPARGGTPDAPIVYRAADAGVIIRGSEPWTGPFARPDAGAPWLCIDLNGWSIEKNPFLTPRSPKPDGITLGQVFIAGEALAQTGDLDAVRDVPGTWHACPKTRTLWIHPTRGLQGTANAAPDIELTVRRRLFAPDRAGLGHIHVEGFILEHCANPFPGDFWRADGTRQAGALGTRGGHHWTIVGNRLRHIAGLGIDCGANGGADGDAVPPPESCGDHLIAHNTLADIGACGIAGAGHFRTRVLHNRIERVNTLGYNAPETGGIKFHHFFDGLIEGNLIRDVDCSGIWLDNRWYRSRVTRNLVINARGSGIFVEMGRGACLVDNNIVIGTRVGDGIYLHDSSGVTVAHNLVASCSHFGIYARQVTEREMWAEDGARERVGCANLTLRNNLLIDNYRGHVCLPPPGDRFPGNVSEGNALINGTPWHWEAAPFHRFGVSVCDGRTTVQDLRARDRDGTLTDGWQFEQGLSLEQWRGVCGFDRSSKAASVGAGDIQNGAIGKGTLYMGTQAQRIECRLPEMVVAPDRPAVPGVDVDYFGVAFAAGGSVRPGPDQAARLFPGMALLWPVKETLR